MPATDEELTQLARKLERYDLNPSVVLEDRLEVHPGALVTLSGSPKDASRHRPVALQTDDLSTLKKWIGVSDSQVEGRTLLDKAATRNVRKAIDKAVRPTEEDAELLVSRRREMTLPPSIGRIARPRTPAVARPTFDTRASLRSYLFGDSRLIGELGAAVRHLFPIFEIKVWPFFRIVIKSGATLVLGPGANVLVASELEIEQGGQLRSYGSLTVDVGNLRKS